MNPQLRRQLVSSTILGRARQSAQAVSPAPRPATPFLDGVIVRVQGSSLLAVTREGDVVMHCDHARIWKGGLVGLSACAPGDQFYATGGLTDGAAFRVSRLWLNIVNITGIVERVTAGGVDIRHTHMGIRVLKTVSHVTIDNATERVDRRSGRRPTERGDYVQVVGVQTGPERIRATRMWG
jgi:hypothetical protein